MNSFFQFLFNVNIFNYWNVDMSTARKIGKTKAMALMMVYWCDKEKGFAGLAMRDTSSNLGDSVVTEIFWALRELNITNTTYSLGKRELKFANGNIIYFRGAQVKTQTQVTLAAFNASYAPTQWIVWLEETYQFSAKQYAEIGQAIRGAPKTIFSTSNPWLEDNWYVDMLSRIQPFNEELLRKNNSIAGSYVSDTQKRLIVYATVYNSPFLTDSIIAQLKNDTQAQPWQERPVLLGMPGVLSGAIYAHLMENVYYRAPQHTTIVDEFTIGIDFGEIRDSTSILLMCSTDGYKDIRVLEEFEYKPTKYNSLGRSELADLVHSTIVNWKSKYKIRGSLQARYDNSAVVFGKRLKVLGPDYEIRYIPCSKKIIVERIDLITMMMNEHRVIFKDNINVLRREMKSAVWEVDKSTGKNIRKRKDGNDHMLNALEYAVERRHRKFHSYLTSIK